ncbi:MAG: fibronectin type III domain-containing protein [candidate division Zixibacteria bacterium]
MKKSIIYILIFIVALCGHNSRAKTVFPKSLNQKITLNDNYCFQKMTDTLGNLWLPLSNRMGIGDPFGDSDMFPQDEELTGNLAEDFNAVINKRTQVDYLHSAGLWVGGIKGNDTLVSHSFDYTAPIPELNPLPCPNGQIITANEWADLEILATAYDTIIIGDTTARCYLGDCRDWYPLGIKVTSHSYKWVTPPYDKIELVEYTITNIDTLPLEEGWVGIYADCDIGYRAPGYENDDISGFINGAIDGQGKWADLIVAYSMDMDGDPKDYKFNDKSPRGAFAIQVLGLSVSDYRVNYNWWVDNHDTWLEWAPRQREYELRNLGNSMAIAYGDSNKYYLMSHTEIDYNQIEAALSHPQWNDPDIIGRDIAQGNDTRFLISAGPFNLQPMEEVTFTVAYMAADSILNNPFIDIWFNPSNPLSVSDWYEVSDFSGLISTAFTALDIFNNGLDYPPPGPPEKLVLVDFNNTSVTLTWSEKSAVDFAGYYVYSRTGNDEWSQVSDISWINDTIATINNLDFEIEYKFAVAAVDLNATVGKLSAEVVVVVGGPHPPSALIGSGNQAYPNLSWSHSSSLDVISYNIYRCDEQFTTHEVIANVSDTTFIDLSARSGNRYEYFVTAVNSRGFESPPSIKIRISPMALTSGILVIDQNSGSLFDNLVFDRLFLDSLLYRGLEGLDYFYLSFDENNPPTLGQLSDYSLLIISAENRGGALSAQLEYTLETYLSNGGKAIILLRHCGIEIESETDPRIIRFRPESIFTRYLRVDSSYIGPTKVTNGYNLEGDLIGASPVLPSYPQLTWDSVRINQFGYGVNTGLPYCGAFWPSAEVEAIYRYQSSSDGSFPDDEVNGIRYLGESYSFYLLNFPLSLMELDEASVLLRTMVEELNEQNICGDINADNRLNIGDIVSYVRYLFHDEEPSKIYLNGDVDCDGGYGMSDLLMLINFYMRQGLAPNCCE